MATSLKVWFSHSSDYENFEAGVKDADSFDLSIPTTNELRWVKGLGDSILLSTSGEEWRIYSPKTSGVITPTNYTVDIQSGFGSNTIQPIVVNGIVLFVDTVGRKLHELAWDDLKQKYLAPDLSALAEHITESGIVGIALQKNPDMIIWCWLNNGECKTFTYNREQNVLAWADMPIDGNVQSICVAPNSTAGEDTVSCAVERTINSENVVYIEDFNSRFLPSLIKDCFFVDSGVTRTPVYGEQIIDKLLLHFDGNDADVTTVDSSLNGHTITFNGTAQLDTAQYKFGTASLLLDGDSDYLTIADSDDWNFGTGDFTVDCVVWLSSIAQEQAICSQILDSTHRWYIAFNSTSKYIQVYFKDTDTRCNYTFAWPDVAINTEYHIAVVRNGANLLCFINGIALIPTVYTAIDASTDFGNISVVLTIGACSSTAWFFNGWIDEFRISKGIARWTTDFTSPTTEYIPENVYNSTVYGLEHLEGQTVCMLADGEVETAVVQNGSISIIGTYETIQIGLPYTYEVQPMRLDVSTQQGTGLGCKKKIPEIVVSLLDSANVEYGDSLTNLKPVGVSDVELVNKSEITGLFTGDVPLHFDGGFSTDDSIIISGSDPLPCTVRCLIPKVDITSR